MSDFTQTLAGAICRHHPLPAFDCELSIEGAYALQHDVTAALTDKPIRGIKAGVTAPMIQKYLGLDHALIGSLYPESEFKNGSTIEALPHRKIETEVAIKVDKTGNPIAIAPAIEIVLLNFERPQDMAKAGNIIACNLGADAYMVGDFLPWDKALADTEVTLRKDGEVVNQAFMLDALGGAVMAAEWMWQEAQKRAFTTGDETLLLAGACGTVVDALSGDYHADFGSLGTVSFNVA